MSNATVYLVDTNILLRFLLGEPPQQAIAAKKLFAHAASGKVVLDIYPLIVAEAFYTLVSFYKIPRKAAAEKLSVLLQQRGIRLRDAQQVQDALTLLRNSNVGFADAFLAASAVEEGVAIASFDRDFDKCGDINRYEPK